MEDNLRVSNSGVHALVAAQLAFDQLDVSGQPGQVRPVPGREVVEHADAVAALEQGADEVRADEPGAARDEDEATHVFSATTW